MLFKKIKCVSAIALVMPLLAYSASSAAEDASSSFKLHFNNNTEASFHRYIRSYTGDTPNENDWSAETLPTGVTDITTTGDDTHVSITELSDTAAPVLDDLIIKKEYRTLSCSSKNKAYAVSCAKDGNDITINIDIANKS